MTYLLALAVMAGYCGFARVVWMRVTDSKNIASDKNR